MSVVCLPARIASILALAVPMVSHAALEEYTSFTAGDSANLAASTVERFLWKSGLECPYTVIRPHSDEVKGFVVFLHGAGDNPTNVSKVAGRLALQEVEYVLPRAPFPTTVRVADPVNGKMESFVGNTWLDGTQDLWHDRGAAFSAFLVGRVIEQILPAHAQGPPLVIVGFRQGAGIAALWAAANPGRVQGLVLVSGYADAPVREALQAPGLSLRDMPCMALVGTESPDAVDSGELAVRARQMGARLETHFAARRVDLEDDDYALIRAFIQRCVEASGTPSTPPSR